MKLPLFGVIDTSSRQNRRHVQDLMYTAMFLIGAPAVALGSIYLVETTFNIMWR